MKTGVPVRAVRGTWHSACVSLGNASPAAKGSVPTVLTVHAVPPSGTAAGVVHRSTRESPHENSLGNPGAMTATPPLLMTWMQSELLTFPSPSVSNSVQASPVFAPVNDTLSHDQRTQKVSGL